MSAGNNVNFLERLHKSLTGFREVQFSNKCDLADEETMLDKGKPLLMLVYW
jgi:hypothetical protein